MSEQLSFTTRRRAAEAIPFKIDKDAFTFNPPKVADLLIRSIIDGENGIESNLHWLKDGLDEADWNRIESRLRDPKDGLEITDLLDVANKLLGKVMENTTGRPT